MSNLIANVSKKMDSYHTFISSSIKSTKKKQGKCLPNHNVVNFHMMHAPCRGLHLTKSAKEYKTVKEEDFKSYPEKEKLKSISSCRRVSRTDLYFDFSLAK